MSGPPSIWVLMGHRRGDNNQLLALAEGLGLPFETRTTRYGLLCRLWIKLYPVGLGHLTNRSRGWIQPPWPDIVVGIGRRGVPVARWIQRESGGRTRIVWLGNPRCQSRLLDLVITTRQYPVPDASNVVKLPLAMGRFRKAPEPTEDERAWLDAHPRPHFLLSLGGSAPSWELSVDALREAMPRLVARAEAAGGSLIVVGSPRTSSKAYDVVNQAIAGKPNSDLLSPTQLRYAVLLNDADENFVTADSVSMISEAVRAGKPVGLIPAEPDARGRRAMKRKPDETKVRDLRRFWIDVERRGVVGTVDEPGQGEFEDPVDTAVAAVRRTFIDLFAD